MRTNSKMMIYQIPEGVPLKDDYIVRVRPSGGEWQSLKTVLVKVDMHDVREASAAYFDFDGEVEVEITFPGFFYVHKVDIRPKSLGISPEFTSDSICFTLEKPVNISVEINNDRFHNLHLFAGTIEDIPDKQGENVYLIRGSLDTPGFLGNQLNPEICNLPEGRLVYIEAGLYYIEEFLWRLPSDTKIYFEGGAVLKGGLIIEQKKNIQIWGRGMLYLAQFERFSAAHGLRISHSENIQVENLFFINPPHYTVCIGESRQISLKNLKAFSCEGWSDGIDMMSCQNVTVSGGFLRNSDDCIAIYGSRWDNQGDSRNITIKDIVLWADVAHPLMVGTHGYHKGEGYILENLTFENIDILEHHEFQDNYLGAIAINAGDKNTVRNVFYRDIRIESIAHGRVFDIRVKWNKDYNPAPGRCICGVSIEKVSALVGDGEEISMIDGYSEEFPVQDVVIDGYYRNGVKVSDMKEANIFVGMYAENIKFKM